MLRTLKSFKHAINGLFTAFKEEPNFKIEILIGAIVFVGAYYFSLTAAETAIIVLCVGFVIAAELVNTSMEDLCNKVESREDPAIKKVKDLMAAFVLIVSLATCVVGVMIFYPYIVSLF